MDRKPNKNGQLSTYYYRLTECHPAKEHVAKGLCAACHGRHRYPSITLQRRLSMSLRNRLNSAIKKDIRGGSAVRDPGCTLKELKNYLEERFQSGMSWDNWAHAGWHIDHIRPLASFDLTKKEDIKKACHYTNLQPLWAKENISKGVKYDEE